MPQKKLWHQPEHIFGEQIGQTPKPAMWISQKMLEFLIEKKRTNHGNLIGGVFSPRFRKNKGARQIGSFPAVLR